MKRAIVLLLTVVTCVGLTARAEEAGTGLPIAKDAKMFIAPMPENFDITLRRAILNKDVPLKIVNDKAIADFVITGTFESVKASKMKRIVLWEFSPDEQASIRVANRRTGKIAYACSAVKGSSEQGQRKAAEICARHLKEKIESGK